MKKYYKIQEVADYFGLKASTLRHWETKIDKIAPIKRGQSKMRIYTQDELQAIACTYKLTKDEGKTLSEINDILNKNSSVYKNILLNDLDKIKHTKQQNDTKYIDLKPLKGIRAFFVDMLNAIESSEKSQKSKSLKGG